MAHKSPNPKKEKQKRRYIVQRTLGRGAFGTVYLTKQEGTENLFAVKETFQNARYKNRESDIIKVLKHPTIVKVFQMFYTEKKDGTYLNIVMEYLPGSLHDAIQQYRIRGEYMPQREIAYYMFQLSRACAYLARRSICHRDIKPQNILVDTRNKRIRLCDFGSAKVLTDGEWNKHYICSRFYRAPELLCESNFYTTTVDIWSIGCVMAEMYLAEPLFGGANTREQLRLIGDILGPVPANYPTKCEKYVSVKPQAWIDVLSATKYRDAQNGHTPSMEAADYISHMLCYDPNNRCDLMETLFHPYNIEMIHLSMIKYNNNNTNNNNNNINNSNDENNSIAKKYQMFEPLAWIEEELPYLQQFGKKYNIKQYDFKALSKSSHNSKNQSQAQSTK